jgi:RNA polymerase sigma factor (sigma-70 family)
LQQRIHNDISDNEVLRRYYEEHNNNEWLGVLLQRYTMLLLGVCMKYLKNEEDAKDSVQQVFLKVINDLPKYKVEYFKSWLYMVTKNHCLMKLRDKGKYPVELNEQAMSAVDETDTRITALEKENHLVSMEQALLLLNSEQQVCIKLFYLQKQTYQQISGSTGLSVMQVKSHIQNGKRNLKIQMQRMQPDEQ